MSRADFRPLRTYDSVSVAPADATEVDIVTQADLDAGCLGVVVTGGIPQGSGMGNDVSVLVYPKGAPIGGEWFQGNAVPSANNNGRQPVPTFRVEWEAGALDSAGALSLFAASTPAGTATAWWVQKLR